MSALLEILWEDAHLLVVNKPGGLLTQPRGPKVAEPSLEDAVRTYLDPKAPDSVYLGTIHRLDRPVSGVIAWAKNQKAARRVAQQFERRSVEKHYAAIIEAPRPGPVVRDQWVDWIGQVGPTGVAVVSDIEGPELRRAITRVALIGNVRLPDGLAALWMFPETGRTHQLRAQAARRGWPIVGDLAYGSKHPFGRGIALHARSLTIHHPILDRRITIEAPWPKVWAEAGFDLSSAEVAT